MNPFIMKCFFFFLIYLILKYWVMSRSVYWPPSFEFQWRIVLNGFWKRHFPSSQKEVSSPIISKYAYSSSTSKRCVHTYILCSLQCASVCLLLFDLFKQLRSLVSVCEHVIFYTASFVVFCLCRFLWMYVYTHFAMLFSFLFVFSSTYVLVVVGMFSLKKLTK